MERLMGARTRSLLLIVLLAATAVLCAVPPAVRAQATQPDAAAVEFFEKRIRPILVEHCHKCHAATASKIKGGLLMDSRADLLKGGDTGPVIEPGYPDKSRLIEAIRYKNVDLQMPPKGKLPDAVIADLTAWVKMGAPWTRDSEATTVAKRDQFDLFKRKQAHWAWQPIRAYQPPRTKDGRWARLPIDAFVLERLEEKGLKPAPAADRRTLLRRVSFDLIGLPPTAQEIEAFLKDDSPRAFEKVVDRLLASPHFGERWARHWLDLVRYAESRGHENDYTTPNAYQYRDYVIRALNADVPYDQFVTEHLAGDLLPKPRLDPRDGFNESILGTGFWLLGEEVHSPVDPRQDEADRFDNRIDVMTKTFLALTVSCARCHDHKFDAISSKDYYALFGFLESSSYRLARFESAEHNSRVAADLARLRERAQPEVHRAIAAVMRDTSGSLADYLLAAREGLLTCLDARQPEGALDRRKLDAIAEARGLKQDLLRAWVAHLRKAAKDSDDVFHVFARHALDAGTNPSREIEGLTSLIAQMRDQAKAEEESLRGADFIVDYASNLPTEWLPDDSGFGPAPSRPGDVRLGGDAKKPIVHLMERFAAVYDRAWDGLRASPGSENDPGALSARIRAGRSIRTPAFTISKGKLYYLVRGVGQAYAAVDQHAVILGPLHAHLVLAINTGGKYQWVCHDLSAYKGHPAHVEFTAAGGADFEVATVIQSERVPAECDAVQQALVDAVRGVANVSPEVITRTYQRLFQDAANRLGADRKHQDAAVEANGCRLANWVLAHPELLDANRESCTQLAKVAGSYVAEENQLRTAIKTDSRLALALQDGSGVDEHVFIRGSTKALGEVAPRRFLEALAGPNPLPIHRGSGRLELARQMIDPSMNPLLPRVMVNRIWHHLFGRGIVASVDNFGVLGEAPTHPELLDYLAQRFVQERWSVKKMIRELVLTNTYQMSSQPAPDAENADPQDLLLHRMRVRRLEGEAIRDALLAVSGRLEPRMYGPAMPVHLTPFLDGRGRPESGPLDGNGRRSLYLAVRRNFLSPFLLTFDTPIPFSTVGRRTGSNVPAQALILMNDPFVHQQAERWARRVLELRGNAGERITGMYVDAISRPPSASELAACLEFVERQSRLHQANPDDLAPWKDLAHALFNVKEFIFLN